MTDLSLILFMITAAALRDTPETEAASTTVPAEGAPIALWRGGQGSPPLSAWLAETGRDPRLRLTIYAPVIGAAQAQALAREAGRPARIVLDPDLTESPTAVLTFDRGMAWPLQPSAVAKSETELSP